MLKKVLLAAAAVSMTAAPVLAAQPVAVETRASADEGDSDLAGGGFIIAIIAAAAVIAGIVIIADEDDSPNSP